MKARCWGNWHKIARTCVCVYVRVQSFVSLVNFKAYICCTVRFNKVFSHSLRLHWNLLNNGANTSSVLSFKLSFRNIFCGSMWERNRYWRTHLLVLGATTRSWHSYRLFCVCSIIVAIVTFRWAHVAPTVISTPSCWNTQFFSVRCKQYSHRR